MARAQGKAGMYLAIFIVLGGILVLAFFNPTLRINYPVRWEKHPTVIRLPVERGQLQCATLVFVTGFTLFLRFWWLLYDTDGMSDIDSAAVPILAAVLVAFIFTPFANKGPRYAETLMGDILEALSFVGIAVMFGLHFLISL